MTPATTAAPMTIGAAEMQRDGVLDAVLDSLSEMFGDLADGAIDSPSRTVIEHGAGNVLLVSPSVWPGRGVGCVKVTTLTPRNPGHGRPLIHGIVTLTDLDTGEVLALLDGAELTAVRTGAVAGLATRWCAAPDADELAVVGAGVQARALVRAVDAVRPLRCVRLASRTKARTEQLADWIRSWLPGPVDVIVYDDVRAAVEGAPIVCTATSTGGTTPVVDADWVARGAHVNVIGGTHADAVELDPRIATRARVVVEDVTAAREGAGEVRAALRAGLVQEADVVGLGAVVRGRARVEAQETSVFRSIGMAVEDAAAAAAVYTTVGSSAVIPARGNGRGTSART